MDHTNQLTAYVAAFVDELAKLGVNHVVVSPGSRSTPIAMLMSEHEKIKVHLNIDERSAGFFALGMAKAKNQPVALVCTSGTAAANYFPAVVEAYYSRVPLLVITADRPHELREVGAPQAINQQYLFSHYAKWFVDTALPKATEEPIRYIRTLAGRAVSLSASGPKGPVHINMPLREPIVPNLSLENLWSLHERENSYVSFDEGKSMLSSQAFEHIGQFIKDETKGLIICGDQLNSEDKQAIVELSDYLQFPIIADPLSQMRSGNHDKDLIIDTYDSFLKKEGIQPLLKPEVVIRFGAMPVSKGLTLFLKAYELKAVFVVDESNGWRDPTLRSTHMIQCNEGLFARELPKYIGSKKSSNSWSEKWIELNKQVKDSLKASLQDKWFEGSIVEELSKLLPANSALFIGNSMPIRDVDSFFFATDKKLHLFANRGANGIDGVVSSALGVSTEYEHTVLLIGDLSFYHDLNGLLAAKMHNLNLTVVLINNDGGGIFSFLPQSKEEKHFEFLFGTPTGLQFEHAANLYAGTFSRAYTAGEFHDALKASFKEGGLHIVEVPTVRTENVEMHREIWNNVSQVINLSKFEE
ncbi:2-succinyl-5-enolpyruvyl-6-hydroxy-3-cyclohexene-1-carboxylic-acid synthase [Priestia sp. GS2]|uniref:2-succinyl-5-enolpyruvyl-6-hydroxy-3- cyclohexene-1-carboxylic-acid synthase n=1 Tax=Priestia sp. GS2 TaxID=3117403 RepID=UPI002ED90E34